MSRSALPSTAWLQNDLTRLPVVESELVRDVVGALALEDLLRARSRLLDEE